MRTAGHVIAGLLLAACASHRPEAKARFEVRATCDARPRCFTQIQAALDAAELAPTGEWIRIDVAPGTWREKVTMRRGRVHLNGAGRNRTRIQFDAVAETSGHYHRRNWGTPGSATLTIDADEVTIANLTIENTWGFLANDALADGTPGKVGNSQAVAVLLDIHSDRVLVDRAALLGYQDTLFSNGARAWIRASRIAGNVDFIFGNGQLLIEDSVIETRRRAAPFAPGELQSFILAPSTPISQGIGIVLYRSRLTRERGVPDGSVALARPWHPTTTFADGRYADPDAVGQASFIDCVMEAHISAQHWTTMNGTARDGTKTAVFRPEDSRFSESGSTGPGARHVEIVTAGHEPPTIEEVRAALFLRWDVRSR